MKDELPDQIHMVLCAVIPLGIVFLLHGGLDLPFELAAGGGIMAGVVSMFAATPLTFAIYRLFAKANRLFAKAKYGKVPEDSGVHTTDSGCSSLIFVILVLLLYPVFMQAKQKREANLQKRNMTEKINSR